MYALSLEKERAWWQEVLIVVAWSLALGLLGKLMIPLPFSPVPLALRSQIVLLMAALLGPKRSAAAVVGFLAQGVIGLPVFTHGAAGWGALIGPNGGYLIGYLAAAIVTGWLAKRALLAALVAGSAVIYLCGAGYLATFVGWEKAVCLGVVPFLLGDAIKVALNWNIVRLVSRRNK